MISLTFPDGSRREFQPGVTGREVAESIAKSLAKKAVAMALDGKVATSPSRSRPMPRSASSRARIRRRSR